MTASTILPIVTVLLGVIVSIGTIAGLVHLGRSRTQRRPGRLLVLRESLALDPRRRLHLVQCGHRQVMLLTGGAQDVVVGWLPDP